MDLGPSSIYTEFYESAMNLVSTYTYLSNVIKTQHELIAIFYKLTWTYHDHGTSIDAIRTVLT